MKKNSVQRLIFSFQQPCRCEERSDEVTSSDKIDFKLQDCPAAPSASFAMTCAFSLAETLTALMIIGVISAIMVPVLYTNIAKQRTSANLKRMYSDFSINIQTVLNYANCSTVSCLRKYGKNNSVDPDYKNLHNGAFADTGITKLIGECPSCFAKNTIMPPEMKPIHSKYKIVGKREDGSDITEATGADLPANFSAYRFENGSAIALFDYQGNCITENKVFFTGKEKVCSPTCRWVNLSSESKPVCGMVVFDINGEKTPNVPGKDRFGYFITDEPIDGSYLLPRGYTYDDYKNNKSNYNQKGYLKSEVAGSGCKPDDKGGRGYNCTAKVMVDNWKIKY